MDTSNLIGSTQDAVLAGLKKKAAAGTAAGATAGNTPDLKKVRGAAQQFEGFFVGQMLDEMTAGLEPDSTFGGGHGEEMWRSMLNQEYGKQIAKTGKIGVTDSVMKSMLKMQEERTAAQQSAQQGTQVSAASANNNASAMTASAAITTAYGPYKR